MIITMNKERTIIDGKFGMDDVNVTCWFAFAKLRRMFDS